MRQDSFPCACQKWLWADSSKYQVTKGNVKDTLNREHLDNATKIPVNRNKLSQRSLQRPSRETWSLCKGSECLWGVPYEGKSQNVYIGRDLQDKASPREHTRGAERHSSLVISLLTVRSDGFGKGKGLDSAEYLRHILRGRFVWVQRGLEGGCS